MNKPAIRTLQTEELIVWIRNSASIWFKDIDLLVLEELIRRLQEAERTPKPEEINGN